MNGSGYKLLGMVVWRGGKWYLRRSYGYLIPSRRTVALAATVGAIGAAALAGRRVISSDD
jgi:hypothetical protein